MSRGWNHEVASETGRDRGSLKNFLGSGRRSIQERRAMMTATFLAALFLPVSASALGLEAGKIPTVEKRRLATVPQNATLKKIYFSPDARRLGFIASRGAKDRKR